MIRFGIAVGTFILGATLASAQFQGEPKYDAASVDTLVDRVQSDLNHAYDTRRFSDADRDRLNHSEKELREFAGKWDHGKFDKGQLNGAIDAIQHVLDRNRMHGDDRDALSDDVTQLRRMKEAYEHHQIQ
jgi:hypothetical protein